MTKNGQIRSKLTILVKNPSRKVKFGRAWPNLVGYRRKLAKQPPKRCRVSTCGQTSGSHVLTLYLFGGCLASFRLKTKNPSRKRRIESLRSSAQSMRLSVTFKFSLRRYHLSTGWSGTMANSQGSLASSLNVLSRFALSTNEEKVYDGLGYFNFYLVTHISPSLDVEMPQIVNFRRIVLIIRHF